MMYSHPNIQNFDYEEYYTTRDPALLASNFTTNLAFLTNNWRHMLGRPTITLMATHYLLGKFFQHFLLIFFSVFTLQFIPSVCRIASFFESFTFHAPPPVPMYVARQYVCPCFTSTTSYAEFEKLNIGRCLVPVDICRLSEMYNRVIELFRVAGFDGLSETLFYLFSPLLCHRALQI